jgi:ABC-type glutathione transport system ATPase component
LVIKIDADHGDNGETGKSLFLGREKEINEIIEGVKSNKGTRLLLVGESGIGKSALLDELYRRLAYREEEDQTNRPFVGYYSNKESLIAESESLLYPLVLYWRS